MQIKILVLFTCFNRREKTAAFLRSLREQNGIEFSVIAVDDNSTDGTREALAEFPEVTVLCGSGSLFYSGGMRMAIAYAKKQCLEKYQYVMLANDDVRLYPDSISRLIAEITPGNIGIGAVCNPSGTLSYSGVVCVNRRRAAYQSVMSTPEKKVYCDTFCANCVLLPGTVFAALPNIDAAYTHTMGDFDYGYTAARAGYKIEASSFFVGECSENPVDGSWQDTKLPRLLRIRKKESPKGLPAGIWFHFLRKNFGLYQAVRGSITPYVRILLGR